MEVDPLRIRRDFRRDRRKEQRAAIRREPHRDASDHRPSSEEYVAKVLERRRIGYALYRCESRLHGKCFYGLTYEEGERRPLMDKAGGYVGLVGEPVRRRTAKESLGRGCHLG